MISVLMIVYNDEQYIREAIQGVLNQSYKNFEFIIIDDCSTDKSYDIAKSFKDKRIRLFRNKKNMGITYNREKSIFLSRYEYLFFTDSDCIADKDWLKEGMKSFKEKNCLGVEGFTVYVHKAYKHTLADRLPGTVEEKGQYMTCNIAYKKQAIIKVGGFDKQFEYNSDRELAIRIKKIGKIIYNKDMLVTHQRKLWTIKSYILSAKRAENRVTLFKKHGQTEMIWWRIVYPKNLIKFLFPPAILYTIFRAKYTDWNDFKLIIAIYPRIIYERYIIWKTAWKEGVFLI